jgi:RHS repeat-associated protein
LPLNRSFPLGFCAILLLAALAAPLTKAQGGGIGNTTSTPVAGVPHDYIAGANEIVNPANGALSIRITREKPHERGQNWPAYDFLYDSNRQFTFVPSWGTFGSSPPTSYLVSLGFQLGSTSYFLGNVTFASSLLTVCQQSGQFTCTNWTCLVQSGYVFTDSNGGQHGLGLQRGIPQTNNTSNDCSFFSINNFYYGGDVQYKASMDPSTFNVTVVDLHGNRPVNEDTNGNFVDTTHRTVAVPALATVQGGSHNISKTFNVLNNSQDGAACGEGSTITLTTSFTSTNSVTLPNGEQYVFGYDSTLGLINKITYPTGATVTYTWSTIPNAEGVQYHTINSNLGGTCSLQHDWFAITKRVVSYDGVTNAEEQDFSYNTTWPNAQSYKWTSKTTTVTTKDLLRGTSFNTVYTYLPALPPAESDHPLEDLGYVPLESAIQYYGTDGSLLKTNTKVWQTTSTLRAECVTLATGQTSGKFYAFQPYSGFNGLFPQPFNFDALDTDLRTDVAEYDYGQVSSTCVQPGSSTIPIRETATAYQSFANSPLFAYNALQDRPSTIKVYGNVGGTKTLLAETDYVYDGSTPSPVSPVPYGHDETNFGSGSAAPRGNPTTVTKKCFVGGVNCTNSVTTYAYDTTGQVLSIKDANLNTTTYSYADSYTTDDGTPSNNTNAFVTKITKPITNGVSHVTQFKYGFNDGKLRLVTDENNLQTKYCYWAPNGCSGTTFDPFVRLTESDNPDGGRTNMSYNDVGPSPSVTTSQTINSSQTMTTTTVTDGLGHAKQTQLTSDPQGTVFTDTTYDGLGQVWKQSNPYRIGTDVTTTTGTTIFVYDSLGRKTTATYPDTSVLTTAYCGAETLVTDPANRWRRSRSDALGRLMEVDEPNVPGAVVDTHGCVGTGEPIWITTYAYDALGNLLSVLQNGTHSRSFTYDSLSRLLTSTNPEVGTITYAYDANSNVLTKKDARNITTCFGTWSGSACGSAGYDAINRLTKVTYSNADPTVTYAYDQSACLGLTACQNIGHRTSMTDAGGSEIWAYQVDALNHRSVHKDQRTNTVGSTSFTKTATYTLDLAGNVTQAVYPTSRTVNYTYDSANRPSTAADGSNGITYTTGFKTSPGSTCLVNVTCYTPQGMPYALSVGQSSTFTNGLNITDTYNNRLQPLEFKASSVGGNAIDITYSFADTLNNNKNAGHVFSITNNLDTTRSQNFTYDQLNRITGALTTSTHATSPTHCWGETYQFDGVTNGAWGNLTQIAATTNPAYTGCSQESGFSKTADGNNHLSGFSYDVSGNTSSDAINSYTWNAESQLKITAATTYLYDGDGRRVAKANTATPPVPSKFYWYGAGGDILAETNGSGILLNEYVFFGGKRIALVPASGNPSYYVEDLLGTSRVMTTNVGVVCYDADFYPYGGERTPITNSCSQNNYKFEGKERDTETGNDDFVARYYSNRFGRWLSADWSAIPVAVPYANLINPQTLNLYSIVGDDPESFADLDGHCDPLVCGAIAAAGALIVYKTVDLYYDNQKLEAAQESYRADTTMLTEIAVDPNGLAGTHVDLNNLAHSIQSDVQTLGITGTAEASAAVSLANSIASNGTKAVGGASSGTNTEKVIGAAVKSGTKAAKEAAKATEGSKPAQGQAGTTQAEQSPSVWGGIKALFSLPPPPPPPPYPPLAPACPITVCKD